MTGQPLLAQSWASATGSTVNSFIAKCVRFVQGGYMHVDCEKYTCLIWPELRKVQELKQPLVSAHVHNPSALHRAL